MYILINGPLVRRFFFILLSRMLLNALNRSKKVKRHRIKPPNLVSNKKSEVIITIYVLYLPRDAILCIKNNSEFHSPFKVNVIVFWFQAL